ncbi:Acetyltransferase (GNAT) family [Serratia rubidaea]|uniref:Acetyltransferase (GNAT) family n=1 Tax=Serratia rubidaea TaxID=61652 RepID=A0A4U9HDT0_SERRU|nr:Acetyltransferase (GNAT) family [Serratia rubidaea]
MNAVRIERITDLPAGYLENNDFTFYVECYAQPPSARRSNAGPPSRWRRIANIIRWRPLSTTKGIPFWRGATAWRSAISRWSKNWNDYTLIEEVAVSRSARRHGIGSALLDAAQQWARERDTAGLMLGNPETTIWPPAAAISATALPSAASTICCTAASRILPIMKSRYSGICRSITRSVIKRLSSAHGFTVV